MKKLISPASSIAFLLIVILLCAALSIAAPFKPPVVTKQNPTAQTYQKARPQMSQPQQAMPQQQSPLQVQQGGKIKSNIQLSASGHGATSVFEGKFCSKRENGVCMHPAYNLSFTLVKFTIPQKNFTKGRVVFAGDSVNFDGRNIPQGGVISARFTKPVPFMDSSMAQQVCNASPRPVGSGTHWMDYYPPIGWHLYITDTSGKPYWDEGAYRYKVSLGCIW